VLLVLLVCGKRVGVYLACVGRCEVPWFFLLYAVTMLTSRCALPHAYFGVRGTKDIECVGG